MRRRALLTASVTGMAGLAGCGDLSISSCRGVVLGIELRAPNAAEERFDLNTLDLSEADRAVLSQAQAEMQTACTRDDSDRAETVTGLVETVAKALGYDDDDLYYSNKEVDDPVIYNGDPYRLRLRFDTAE